MVYNKTIKLKNGKTLTIRNGVKEDGEEVFACFNATHEETDYMLSYIDENSFGAKEEGEFLDNKTKSENECELVAIIDNKIVGTAGIEAIGTKYKVKHRADLGIGIYQKYCGMGIGTELIKCCIELAKKAKYTQLELNAVAENQKAISLYKKLGFVEYGRNPRGFNSRFTGYQELVYMKLEL